MTAGVGRRAWALAQWLVVPCLVLGAAELAARHSPAGVPRWYAAADALAAREPLDVLFIGSSRVEAAVDVEAFEAAVWRRSGRRVRALNLGRGYSTDAAHFFGVRNLLERHPERLRGLDVFAEAPGGLPFPTYWRHTPWAQPEQPFLLAEQLRAHDLRGLWRFAGLDLETRLHVSARVLLRRCTLFGQRERVRELALGLLPAMWDGRLGATLTAPPLGADLRAMGRGSIRSDPEAVRAARALALDFGRSLSAHQAPWRNYAPTISASLVALLRARGGRVVFFEPPQSTPFLAAYATPLRQEDARQFAEQARAWGTTVLRPDFAYDDGDLPDLWHLRPERAPEFSARLAAAWLEAP